MASAHHYYAADGQVGRDGAVGERHYNPLSGGVAVVSPGEACDLLGSSLVAAGRATAAEVLLPIVKPIGSALSTTMEAMGEVARRCGACVAYAASSQRTVLLWRGECLGLLHLLVVLLFTCTCLAALCRYCNYLHDCAAWRLARLERDGVWQRFDDFDLFFTFRPVRDTHAHLEVVDVANLELPCTVRSLRPASLAPSSSYLFLTLPVSVCLCPAVPCCFPGPRGLLLSLRDVAS